MTREEFYAREYLPAKRAILRDRLLVWGVPLIVLTAWVAVAVMVAHRIGVLR